jgi:hypothetical protein
VDRLLGFLGCVCWHNISSRRIEMTARPHTFATITDADWRRELRARRAAMDSNHRLGTALLAKVRNRIAAQQTQHNSMKAHKKTNAYTVIEVLIVLAFLTIGTSWIVNFYKLTQCDFAAPYQGEGIHAVGIIPVASLVTVWFNHK